MKNVFGFIVVYIISFNLLIGQDLDYCADKYKLPYRIVKLNLIKIIINHEQLLQILDSLIIHEKKCDADFYFGCKYFWGISIEKEDQNGLFLLVYLTPSFNTKSSFSGYFLVQDAVFLISKEIIQKKLEFITECKENKIFISKPSQIPYILDAPEWLLFFSYKEKKFYVMESAFTTECK